MSSNASVSRKPRKGEALEGFVGSTPSLEKKNPNPAATTNSTATDDNHWPWTRLPLLNEACHSLAAFGQEGHRCRSNRPCGTVYLLQNTAIFERLLVQPTTTATVQTTRPRRTTCS